MSVLGDNALTLINIRHIDEDVMRQLKARASAHGCSVEKEVTRIIAAAVKPSEQLGDVVTGLFASSYDSEGFVAPAREPSEPITFE